MFQSFITKNDLITRVHKAVKLMFFRKNIKGSKAEQVESVEKFIEIYLKAYDFKADLIHIDFHKKGIRIKLKNLRRYKSRDRLEFLSKLDFLPIKI
ncbi:MAG: hypothetical protein ACTSO9_08635 [Candidatus Helarchaeota archaeon]